MMACWSQRGKIVEQLTSDLPAEVTLIVEMIYGDFPGSSKMFSCSVGELRCAVRAYTGRQGLAQEVYQAIPWEQELCGKSPCTALQEICASTD